MKSHTNSSVPLGLSPSRLPPDRVLSPFGCLPPFRNIILRVPQVYITSTGKVKKLCLTTCSLPQTVEWPSPKWRRMATFILIPIPDGTIRTHETIFRPCILHSLTKTRRRVPGRPRFTGFRVWPDSTSGDTGGTPHQDGSPVGRDGFFEGRFSAFFFALRACASSRRSSRAFSCPSVHAGTFL